MLFNSYTFLFVFLPLAWAGFRLFARLGDRAVTGWLLVASLGFYSWWNPLHLPLLLASIVVNGWWGRRLARTGRGVGLAVAANLLLLGVFKYADLGARTLGWFVEVEEPHLELPLAISFFTFQQIAYVVECARRREASDDPLRYALFVTFFPQLIAGPIVSHDTFVAQLRKPGWFKVPVEVWGPGIALFVLGLFKKLAIADAFAPTADVLFDATGPPDLAAAWRGTLAYSLQIYFDFSGYSDMALGLGRLFGVRLPINFDAPYRSTSIVDFWRRWHITLSTFLRDYLYIPLGGNRRGNARRWVNLFLTMLLGGLWHGPAWTFVGWGAMHGLLLGITHAWWKVVGRGRIPRVLAVPATFVAVAFAWVLFRAEALDRSFSIWGGLVGLNGFGALVVDDLWLLGGLLLCLGAPVSWRWIDEREGPLTLVESIGIGVAAFVSLLLLQRVTPFLYFQF